jgi:hypothetical protein
MGRARLFWDDVFVHNLSVSLIIHRLNDDVNPLTFRTDEEDALVYRQIRILRKRLLWAMKDNVLVHTGFVTALFKKACRFGYMFTVEIMVGFDYIGAFDVMAGLETAVKYNQLCVTLRLIQYTGVNPSTWIICVAASHGYAKMIRELLKDRRVNPCDDNNALIRWASANGYLKSVRELINDPRVDPSDLNNWAIRVALRRDYKYIVRELYKDIRVQEKLSPTEHEEIKKFLF